jgi:hypothetical protein
MYEIGTNLAYEHDGVVVLSKAYVLDSKEREAAALVTNLRSEGMTRVEAAAHAVSVLPQVDPDFVQFLSGGVLSAKDGRLTGDETTMEWLARIRQRVHP